MDLNYTEHICRVATIPIAFNYFRCFLQSLQINASLLLQIGAWGSVVVKALGYKSVGPGIDSKR